MARGRPRRVTVEEAGNPIPPLDRLTVRVMDAAHLLSVSRAAVYRLAGGEIEAAKSGQKTMIIVSSIREFIERNRVDVRSARP